MSPDSYLIHYSGVSLLNILLSILALVNYFIMRLLIRILTLSCLLTMLICGCKEDDPMATPPDVDPFEESFVKTIIPTGSEDYLLYDSDYIFDQDSLYTFELILPPAHLEKINEDPSAEQYLEGQIVFKGDTISPVGIRYKGSIGAFVDCLSGDDWANPNGFKTCTKLSMKVKVNWKEREDKFFKMNKLQFHSMNNDASQMRERLGYHLFRSMNTPAPRAVHARLLINGEYNGLFALVENVDGRFVKNYFDDDDGNLYKELWPLTNQNTIHSDQKYFSALKTNEDESPSFDIIKNFGQEVIASSESEMATTLEKHLDVNEILSYAVVDRTIRHDDGPFHWYCGENDCSSHNFYWYEEPISKKMHLIAWDLDNAFENIVNQLNPVTTIADEWGETQNNCNPFPFGFLGIEQWSAACDKITQGLSQNDQYDVLKEDFINGPFSQVEVDALLEKWSDQIRMATLEAREKHNDAVSEFEWESAINQLRIQCEVAKN